jgi:hypothetical protein
MSTQAGIPLFNIPPIDPRSGQWNRQWLLFLQALWDRTGGAQGVSVSDLGSDLPEDSGVEEVKAQLFGLRDTVFMLPPVPPAGSNDDQTPGLPQSSLPDDPSGRIEALEALVQRLVSDIEAIRQGQQL